MIVIMADSSYPCHKNYQKWQYLSQSIAKNGKYLSQSIAKNGKYLSQIIAKMVLIWMLKVAYNGKKR